MWNVHFLIVFIHICNLRVLYMSWYSYVYIFFCLHMFLTDNGWSYMAWQMMSLPLLGGISLIWSKNQFCSMYTSVSAQTHLFNIMNFVGIASHITCTFLSGLLYKFSCMHPDICLHFDIYTYFCLGMLGIDCGCRDMAWQINPSHIWLKITVTF